MRGQIASLIEEVLEGRTTASEALRRADLFAPSTWNDSLVTKAWHALVHFCDDEDIRSRDEAYSAAQRAGLHRYVDKLRAQETD